MSIVLLECNVNPFSHPEVRRRTLGRRAQTLGEVLSLSRLKCLDHVLGMSGHRLLR